MSLFQESRKPAVLGGMKAISIIKTRENQGLLALGSLLISAQTRGSYEQNRQQSTK